MLSNLSKKQLAAAVSLLFLSLDQDEKKKKKLYNLRVPRSRSANCLPGSTKASMTGA